MIAASVVKAFRLVIVEYDEETGEVRENEEGRGDGASSHPPAPSLYLCSRVQNLLPTSLGRLVTLILLRFSSFHVPRAVAPPHVVGNGSED